MENIKRPGRPIVKPKRKMTSFAINQESIGKMQLLQIKRNGESLNDLFNEAIINLLKSENI
jgi:hypothetical protein